MKKFSREFLVSVTLIVISFFIVQFAVMPSVYPSQTAAIRDSVSSNVYQIVTSKLSPEAFSFNYQFGKLTALKKGESSFDLPIMPFDEHKISSKDTHDFGSLRDAWNYPVHENAFMKASHGSSKSGGDNRSDEDPNVLGQLNCRENTDITGYFKAYFEDVALGNGIHFDDPTFGEARREEACQVLQDIAHLIKLDETDVTPDVLFTADNGNMPFGALGAASAYFGYDASHKDDGTLHKHIISHEDPTAEAGSFDAFVMVNFNGVNWDVDSDLNPSTYNMYSVLYHEILHSLGFRGLLPSVIATTGDAHVHDTFDSYSYKDETLSNPFFNGNNLGTPTGAPPAWFITNDVVYRGIKNVVGVSPDGIRPVYSPASWQQGSSLSHFDMDRANGEVYVMHPSIPANTTREVHHDEKEVLCHLGYQVLGISGCEYPTPLARDDTAVIPDSGEQICVEPIINDDSFGSGSLRMRSVTPIQIETGDVITYYTGMNCSGVVLPNADGAYSFAFLPASPVEPRILLYSNKVTLSGRISNEARIKLVSLANCSSDEDEYICNGDFEMSFTQGGVIDVECPTWDPIYSDTLFWCNYLDGNGLVLTQEYNPYLFTPENGDYLADVNENFPATFVTKLKQPLEAGEDYVLSFDVAAGDPVLYSTLVFGFNSEPTVANPGPWSSSPASTPEQQLPAVGSGTLVANTQGIYTWYHHELAFTANGNYEAFVFGDNHQKHFLDNFSLKKASDIVTPEEGDSAIKGKVYYDENTNAYLDVGELGLSGIQVGLFEPGNSTPIQTTFTEDYPHLGEYSFLNLPSGLYRMALINESVFSQITQPLVNTLIPGYSYARETNLPGGQSSVLNHFGVVLDSAPTVNVHIKKGLIDSTLSLFDRNITWQVEATNTGVHDATNIDILDLPPAPLIYYSHVTQTPNTYNPSTGIWHIPHLAIGQTAIIQITMKVPQGTCGTKINMASLSSVDQEDTDPTDNASQAQIKLRACGNTIESVK